jgi:hypothetical protein
LKYYVSAYVDPNGNRFRYKARVGDKAGQEHEATYDVFPVIDTEQKEAGESQDKRAVHDVQIAKRR